MKYKVLALIGVIIFSAQSFAAPSINDLQSCQALLDFVDDKLTQSPTSYPSSDIKLVRSGLDKYNDYIQKEVVSPSLLKFSGGDVGKAKAMQGQVDAYKKALVTSLHNRYKTPGVFTDHAIAINECAKKAAPSGKALDDLKTALETMIKLAKI